MLKELISLRHQLHQNPEVSSQEVETAKRITDFIQNHSSWEIISNLGGHSLAAVYTFGEGGKTIAIRCELDALPIQESDNNTMSYKSVNSGVSHKCGHDGHMTMVAGLIFEFENSGIQKGKIVLLFQSAEETGLGAKEILASKKFKELNVDQIYSLHNIPGMPMKSVIITKNSFTATVQSIAIKIQGKITHAALPEKGINPTHCIKEIIEHFESSENRNESAVEFYLASPIYSQIGEKNYGTAAAYGEIHYTIRTWSDGEMTKRVNVLESHLSVLAQKFKVKITYDYFDYYPASANHQKCTEVLNHVASHGSFELIHQEFPFRFGEDFGWYSKEIETAMFGLGSGTETPALHNDDYNFPDEIIETGIQMFKEIILKTLI